MKIDNLLDAARDIVHRSHSPYSGFSVAAILEDRHGNLYGGVNVENASFGLSMCAERSAVFRAVAEGGSDFRRLLVYSPDGKPFPCGACRQVLSEFCPGGMEVIVATGDSMETFTLEELLPHSFNLK